MAGKSDERQETKVHNTYASRQGVRSHEAHTLHAQHPRGHRLKRGGGGDQGGSEGRAAGHSRDGHGDCELWINCHRVFDLWCLCRYAASLSLSFSSRSPADAIYSPCSLLSKVIPLFSDVTPFLLFFLRFAFVWLIVLDRARFQRTASPSLSSSFFYNNDFCLTNIFHSFALFFFPLFLSLSCLFPCLTTVLITVLMFTNLSLSLSHRLSFLRSVDLLGRKVNDSVWHGGCGDYPDVSGHMIRVYKFFNLLEVPPWQSIAAATRGCCIINFRPSITGVCPDCRRWS